VSEAWRRDNLPAELSDFVGRRRETSEIRRLLEGNRLVTLIGTGGVGKTRLAVQVARQVRRASPDGVWLVELAAVADPEHVPAAVAGVWGVTDRSPRSVLAALAGYLEDKRLLLVLDNCEHLIEACALLVGKLLGIAPELRVVATSREPLRVDGEQVFPVAPLATPDPAAPPAGDLSEFEGVRLFVDRARAVLPTFAVTAANRVAVAGVCRRLDGIPLAIELAAARLRVLSVEQILSRLDDRFRLLTTRSRVAPARHQTLRAALGWSHELCSSAEQALWARASVFAGGFDLEAAEAVCAGDGIHSGEILKLVAGLLDKSILVRVDGAGVAARYGLLETVRQYGRQRLVATGQQGLLVARHRDYYQRLARQAKAEQVSPQEVAWLLRLRRELPNLRLAMEAGLAEPAGAHAALEIAVAMRDLWFGGGRNREGQRWLTRALAADPEPTAARAVALADAGYLTKLLGDAKAGRRMLAEAQALADRLGDPAAHAAVTFELAACATITQPPEFARGLALTEQALTYARAAGDLRTESIVLLLTAIIGAFTSDSRAAGNAAQCRALGEAHGAEWTRSWGLLVLALVRWQQGNRDQVAALLHEALSTQQIVHDGWGAGIGLEILAWTAAADGRHEHGARLLGASQAIKRREGAAMAELGPFAEHHAACIHEVQHALGDTAYTAAFDEGTRFTLDEAINHAFGKTHTKPTVPSPRPAQLDRDPLTPREEQIADLVAHGLTNQDIATHLVISKRTAESHIENILTKLGFNNRTQIARWITEREQT
jgi:predicted ATPase/DNA-binding CsgD family transcriptional regulator